MCFLHHALLCSHCTAITYAERPWNESLSARIAEVQDCYKNIPPKLYFSPSSVSFEGIGVYAAEPLPQGSYTYHSIAMFDVLFFNKLTLNSKTETYHH